MANSVFLFPGNLSLSGRLFLSDGNAAAPSLTFSSDPTKGFYSSILNEINLVIAGAVHSKFDGSGYTLRSTHRLAWGSSFTDSPDTILVRDAANTLALRNGTNAQQFGIYNTFTSATNFERAEFLWFSNIFWIGTRKGSGGGVSRAVNLMTDGTERWQLATNGHFLAMLDNTYDIGASGASRPRTGYFGTSLYAPLLSIKGANAQELKILQNTVQSGAMAGATLTLTNLIPAGSLVVGVTIHPTTAITSGDGGTTYSVGDGTDVDRWGATIAFASDVKLTDATIVVPPIYPAATNIILTCNGGKTFNAGVVRVTVHYLTVVPETT